MHSFGSIAGWSIETAYVTQVFDELRSAKEVKDAERQEVKQGVRG